MAAADDHIIRHDDTPWLPARVGYGKRSEQAMSALDFGKEVTLQLYGKDKYQRTIGDVILTCPGSSGPG